MQRLDILYRRLRKREDCFQVCLYYADTFSYSPDAFHRLARAASLVEKNETIALMKEFFGMVKKEVKSPCKGTIELVSEVSGQVIIREAPVPVEINAYIPGVVHGDTDKRGGSD
jgi:hypothetical protein